jgi:hypothetical protein
MTIRRKFFSPLLQSHKNKRVFLLLNIYLIIGVSCLWISAFYLLSHLHNSDRLIKYCLPLLVIGISSALVYFVGSQKLISDRQNKKLINKLFF